MARKAKSKVKTKAKVKKSAARKAARPKSRAKSPKRTASPKAKAKARKSASKKTAGKKTAKKTVSPIPAGYNHVQPYLIVDAADAAIDFYKRAFGAKERLRMPMPGGRIGHAELEIGDAVIMLADEAPEWNAHGPRKFGGSPVSIMLYVMNVDDTVKKAVKAGGKVTREVKDQFYGDRSGGIEDPFGHHWHIATHFEDVPMKEMERRMKAMHQTPPEVKQPLSQSSPAHPGPESPEEAEASS